jgi:hypothetical protein
MYEGKAQPELLSAVKGPEKRAAALMILAQVRWPVIGQILVAGPVATIKVSVDRSDPGFIYVMGPPKRSLEEYSLAQADSTWVKKLASGPRITGPLLGVAREVPGRVTLLDGLHRGAAWVMHTRTAGDYPVPIHVVLTERPTIYEGS